VPARVPPLPPRHVRVIVRHQAQPTVPGHCDAADGPIPFAFTPTVTCAGRADTHESDQRPPVPTQCRLAYFDQRPDLRFLIVARRCANAVSSQAAPHPPWSSRWRAARPTFMIILS